MQRMINVRTDINLTKVFFFTCTPWTLSSLMLTFYRAFSHQLYSSTFDTL